MNKTKWLLLAFACAMTLGYSSAAIDVSSCDDLANVNNDLTTGYILTQNLDCSGSGNSIMIGADGNPFVGTFDGSGYTITVDIDMEDNYLGLFRRTNGATISNITVSGSVISTLDEMMDYAYIGGLVGRMDNTVVSNAHSSASIQSEGDIVGGLAGYLASGYIVSSSSSSFVDGGATAGYVGGLVGEMVSDSIVEESYAIGNVSGESIAGGLVGYMLADNQIIRSYALGDVSASNQQAGGLVGQSVVGSIINDSYAMGSTNAPLVAGGLISYINETTINRSYAAGSVAGSTMLGGLVGGGGGSSITITDSFWDTQTTTMATSEFGGSGATTAEMTDIDIFSGAGWDFDTVWDIDFLLNNGYPYLQWQTFADPETDLLIYMNDNGPDSTGSSTHSYSIEYVNGGSNTEDVLITLEGVDINNFQQASGLNDPTFSGYTDSYIQRTEELFANGASGSLEFLISHDSDGAYVYTATISSAITDSNVSNNSFTVFSTVDTIAPETLITSAGGDAVDAPGATFEFISNEDSVTFECSIDDGITIEDFAPCVSPYMRTGFIQGVHIFYVRAVDVANNPDPSPAIRTWTIADSEELLSVSPVDGASNVATDATIVVTFAQPVVLTITINAGPCDGSGSICPELDGVWSSGNTVLTHTRTDEDFHNDTSYSIQITENNGIHWHQLYSGAFTIASTPVPSGGGGGGGGVGQGAIMNRAPNITPAMWKAFYAQHNPNGTSNVGDTFTVQAFITDVFTLLGITKPLNRKPEHETQEVPQKLVNKVMQVLVKLLATK